MIAATLVASSLAAAQWYPKDAYVQKMLASHPPADDSIIVPRWRIGPLYLGMPVAEMVKLGAKPARTYDNGAATFYEFDNASRLVVVTQDARIARLQVGSDPIVASNAFTLAEGIHHQSAEIEVIATFGKPDSKMDDRFLGGTYYCYFDRGVYFFIDRQSGAVHRIGVATKNELYTWCKN